MQNATTKDGVHQARRVRPAPRGRARALRALPCGLVRLKRQRAAPGACRGDTSNKYSQDELKLMKASRPLTAVPAGALQPQPPLRAPPNALPRTRRVQTQDSGYLMLKVQAERKASTPPRWL